MPLNFVSSVFGMNAREFSEDGNTDLSYIMKYMRKWRCPPGAKNQKNADHCVLTKQLESVPASLFYLSHWHSARGSVP
jgi:hypothetical protein